MIFSIEWLNSFCKINSNTKLLSDSLTMRAAEIEEIIPAPKPVKEARLVRIINVKKHPNADKLKLVELQVSKKKQTVVCGANNISIGDVVPLLSVGNHYYDSEKKLQKLSAATIRGIKSQGMLASERDLGLSNEHQGILILKNNTKAKNLQSYLGWTKPLLKLEITPNRSDLFSYFGLSREISVIEKSRLNDIKIEGLSIDSKKSTSKLNIDIDTKDCLRYAALTIDSITNRQSPLWLSNRLRLSGINPINAIVDITNYVMLELGQPLHAFDFDKLKQSNGKASISVKKAENNKIFTTLDGTKLNFTNKDTIISNNDVPIALAGIVGGINSQIDPETTKIILEAAIFDAGVTRRSSIHHNLRTESSTRFEKGIDPELPVIALKRAAALIKEICDGEVVGRIHDLKNSRFEKRRVNISLIRAAKSLGFEIDKIKVKNLLSSIGFSVTTTSKDTLGVIVPSWRIDVEIEEDIFEEIARLIGYENISPTTPGGDFKTPKNNDSYWQLRNIKEHIANRNFFEAVSQPFVSDSDMSNFHLNHLVEIDNPTTKNEKYLRPNVSVPLIKRAIAESRNSDTANYFEIGRVFIKNNKKLIEYEGLSLVTLCNNYTSSTRYIKQLISGIKTKLNIKNNICFKSSKSDINYLADNIENICIEDKVVGFIGILKLNLLKRGKVRGNRHIVVCEINLKTLLNLQKENQHFRKSSAYPPIKRDISLLIKKGTIINAIESIDTKKIEHLVDYFVKDIFETETGKKSITISFIFQSYDYTLKDEYINKQIDKVISKLSKNTDIQLRIS